jgi:hypothetical protein
VRGALKTLQTAAPERQAVALSPETLPPPSEEEPDFEHIAAVAEANGCELLG